MSVHAICLKHCSEIIIFSDSSFQTDNPSSPPSKNVLKLMQYWHSDIKQSQACLPIQVGGLVTSFSMVVCKTFYAYERFFFFNFRPASTWSPLYPVIKYSVTILIVGSWLNYLIAITPDPCHCRLMVSKTVHFTNKTTSLAKYRQLFH